MKILSQKRYNKHLPFSSDVSLKRAKTSLSSFFSLHEISSYCQSYKASGSSSSPLEAAPSYLFTVSSHKGVLSKPSVSHFGSVTGGKNCKRNLESVIQDCSNSKRPRLCVAHDLLLKCGQSLSLHSSPSQNLKQVSHLQLSASVFRRAKSGSNMEVSVLSRKRKVVIVYGSSLPKMEDSYKFFHLESHMSFSTKRQKILFNFFCDKDDDLILVGKLRGSGKRMRTSQQGNFNFIPIHHEQTWFLFFRLAPILSLSVARDFQSTISLLFSKYISSIRMCNSYLPLPHCSKSYSSFLQARFGSFHLC